MLFTITPEIICPASASDRLTQVVKADLKLFDNDSLLGADPEVGVASVALVALLLPAALASLFFSFQAILLVSLLANYLAWLCRIVMYMAVLFLLSSLRP